MMKAVIVVQPGGADQLKLVEQVVPVPRPDELLVKVAATTVNRTDIVNRQSEKGYLDNPILGVEVAGVVVSGDEAGSIPVGSRVMGLVNGGGYAEYVTMPADRAMLIPENLSFEDAAAIPEVFLTAYQTLFWLGKLTAGETVLIHAGGSGVGTAAIQLAHQLGQATVITTAGSDEKLAFARSLGADVGINYKKQDFAEEVLSVTQQRGVDLILDFVGASYWQKNLTSIGLDGRWILIGILGGSVVPEVNLFDLLLKRVQLQGTLLTPRSDAYKARLTADFSRHVLPLFGEGRLRPIVDQIFSLEEMRAAHEYMESNRNTGKIIVRVG